MRMRLPKSRTLGKISLIPSGKWARSMILHLFHDRRALADVATLRVAIEECFGAYGLQVRESGYLYVPLAGQKLNAAKLLKHLARASCRKEALWLVDRELFYPEIGQVLGCSARGAALLYGGLEPDVLAREALHEVGHLLGLEHCPHSCVMRLSATPTPEDAREKPSRLCQKCSERLARKTGSRRI